MNRSPTNSNDAVIKVDEKSAVKVPCEWLREKGPNTPVVVVVWQLEHFCNLTAPTDNQHAFSPQHEDAGTMGSYLPHRR